MLAQVAPPADVGQLAVVLAWIAALVFAFGPGARGLTWLVDRVRDVLERGGHVYPRVLWPAIALAIALAACLLFQINIAGGILRQLPRFVGSSAFDGTWGQIVTAVGLAGFSSSWHDRDSARKLNARVRPVG